MTFERQEHLGSNSIANFLASPSSSQWWRLNSRGNSCSLPCCGQLISWLSELLPGAVFSGGEVAIVASHDRRWVSNPGVVPRGLFVPAERVITRSKQMNALANSSNGIDKLLGIRASPWTLPFLKAVTAGLPVKTLHRLARVLAPCDRDFAFRVVPRSTLARRRTRLTAKESARLARLACIWDRAFGVWRSDDSARMFLFRPHRSLGGRCPIDVVLASELGRPLVEQILGRLSHGVAP